MSLPENFIEFLLSGVIALIVWIFKTVTARHAKDLQILKDEQERKWQEHKAESLRREEQEEKRREGTQAFFTVLIQKHSEEMKTLMSEGWEDLRDFKTDRRRYDEEVWKQLTALKDRQGAAELQQAKSYHTKPELDALLAEKLAPIKQSLSDISRQLGKRSTD